MILTPIMSRLGHFNYSGSILTLIINRIGVKIELKLTWTRQPKQSDPDETTRTRLQARLWTRQGLLIGVKISSRNHGSEWNVLLGTYLNNLKLK